MLLLFFKQLVREQKQRLQERSKTTENLTQQNKQLTTKLERAIDELKKIREQILLLQKERREVDARLIAQESILSGLREEKKLWSHELAHQGLLNFSIVYLNRSYFSFNQVLHQLKIVVVQNQLYKL